jgi:CP family cyanate transporter-like MFS transporter
VAHGRDGEDAVTRNERAPGGAGLAGPDPGSPAPAAVTEAPRDPAPPVVPAAPVDAPEGPAATRLGMVVLAAAILLIALNLRPAVVAVSPLVGQIRADLGLSSAAVGLLTTLPVLCFGLLAPLAPRLARRWHLEIVLLGVLILLGTGILLRLVPVLPALFLGSLLAGAAIAVGNVLMPAIVKRDFPRHTGVMTGAYSVTISAGGALAAGVMVPLEQATGLGWRPVLALWAVVAGAGIALWLPWVRRAHGRTSGPPTTRVRGLWRSPLAWSVTLFMGLQSTQFYALTAWVPTLFTEAGVPAASAGLLLSLSGLASLVTSAVVPVLAARSRTQFHLVALVVGTWLVGYTGLILDPVGLGWLWMVLIGLGQGAGISLALTLIALRSPDAAHTSQLSGMAQGVGYVIACLGPFTLGAVRDATGGWTAPLLVLIGLLVPLVVAGVGAARDRQVGSTA